MTMVFIENTIKLVNLTSLLFSVYTLKGIPLRYTRVCVCGVFSRNTVYIVYKKYMYIDVYLKL